MFLYDRNRNRNREFIQVVLFLSSTVFFILTYIFGLLNTCELLNNTSIFYFHLFLYFNRFYYNRFYNLLLRFYYLLLRFRFYYFLFFWDVYLCLYNFLFIFYQFRVKWFYFQFFIVIGIKINYQQNIILQEEIVISQGRICKEVTKHISSLTIIIACYILFQFLSKYIWNIINLTLIEQILKVISSS